MKEITLYKKISHLIVFTLAISMASLYCMKRPREENLSDTVKKVLLGVEEPRIFLQTLSFTDLPPEIQNHIIEFASLYSTAQLLNNAGRAINSLAQVNKELNQKINDPIFCLQLIKHLAKRFHCTDFDACEALQTHAAKQRLELQRQLYTLCRNIEPLDYYKKPVSLLYSDKKHINMSGIYVNEGYNPDGSKSLPDNYDFDSQLLSLVQQNADLEFTYPDYRKWHVYLAYDLSDKLRNMIIEELTPLMIVALNFPQKIGLLVSQGAHINGTTNKGQTLLMFIAQEKMTELITLLLEQFKNSLRINQQDVFGATALIYCFIQTATSPENKREAFLNTVQVLLDAGANPNLADNEGNTPLEYAHTYKPEYNKDAIPLIQQAIEEQENK